MTARLPRVINSCILMTYAPRQWYRKGRAPESRATVTAAVRAIARCRRALGARLLHLSVTGVPLLAACPAIERAGRRWRIEVGVHGEAAAQFDPTGAVVRICQKALDQRSGQPGAARVAAKRARARSWLSRSRSSLALFTWNIVSIVCCRKSWRKPIKCWCRINVGRSPSQGPPASRKLRR